MGAKSNLESGNLNKVDKQRLFELIRQAQKIITQLHLDDKPRDEYITEFLYNNGVRVPDSYCWRINSSTREATCQCCGSTFAEWASWTFKFCPECGNIMSSGSYMEDT